MRVRHSKSDRELRYLRQLLQSPAWSFQGSPRRADSDPPDFEVECEGAVHAVEVTELYGRDPICPRCQGRRVVMQEIEPNLPRLMDSLSDAWAKQRLGNVEVEIVIAEQAKLTKSTIGAMASMVVSRLVAEYPNLARERLAPVGGGYFGHGIAMLRARRIGERRDSRFRFGTLAPVLSLEPRLRDCINRKQRQLNGYARRYGSTHLLVAIPANTASALFSAKDAANGLSHEFAFDAVWLLDATTGIVTPVVRASSAPALGN